MHKILLILTFVLVSCSSHKPGQHFYLTNNQHIDKLSKRYNLSISEIKQANPGKKLVAGEWIFLPYKGRVIASLGGSFVADRYYGKKIFSWPVPSSRRISSYFGRRGRRHHDGIDIPAKRGTHFIAATDGRVLFNGRLRGYGKTIIVSHANNFHTVYAHLNRSFVRKGEVVSSGQVLGQVGNTGRSSGSHLHFEVRKNNKILNPIPFMRWVPNRNLASQ